ncbi:MAG: AlpA family phage regulatory protein [Pseudomonadota bacterium]
MGYQLVDQKKRRRTLSYPQGGLTVTGDHSCIPGWPIGDGMNLDMNQLPKQVLDALRATARRDRVAVGDIALRILSDSRTIAMLGQAKIENTSLQTRAIRREELLEIVPLGHTTIYRMELKGEFPSRFYLTDRCAAWDFAEVMEWLKQRQLKTKRNKSDLSGLPGIGPFNERRSRA